MEAREGWGCAYRINYIRGARGYEASITDCLATRCNSGAIA
jgi:hypothetical protein